MVLRSEIQKELADSEEVLTRTDRIAELRNELQTIQSEEEQDDVSIVHYYSIIAIDRVIRQWRTRLRRK